MIHQYLLQATINYSHDRNRYSLALQWGDPDWGTIWNIPLPGFHRFCWRGDINLWNHLFWVTRNPRFVQWVAPVTLRFGDEKCDCDPPF